MSLKSLAILPLVVVGALASSQAFAQATCPSGFSRVNNLVPLLTGNTVCGARAPDRWQEYHAAGGSLVDYKKGPNDAVDPTEPVGTWSIREGIVTHNYGSSSYSWIVCTPSLPATLSSVYTFRSTGSSGDVTGVTLKAGGPVACP